MGKPLPRPTGRLENSLSRLTSLAFGSLGRRPVPSAGVQHPLGCRTCQAVIIWITMNTFATTITLHVGLVGCFGLDIRPSSTSWQLSLPKPG